MKLGLTLVFVGGGLSFAGTATAQTAPPPERVGFQMAARTGFSLPLGSAAKDLDMSDVASGQVPLMLDIGGKVHPNLFVGGYMGFGFGGPAGNAKNACEAGGGNCLAVSFRLGIEVLGHFNPRGAANPWLGYGVGLASLAIGESRNGRTESYGFGGFDFAHLMGGVDFRLSRGFGIGPYIDFSLGQYNSISNGDVRLTISEKAVHEWLTLGVRFVIFP